MSLWGRVRHLLREVRAGYEDLPEPVKDRYDRRAAHGRRRMNAVVEQALHEMSKEE